MKETILKMVAVTGVFLLLMCIINLALRDIGKVTDHPICNANVCTVPDNFYGQ